MDSKSDSLIMRNTIFAWIALGTGLILLIPVIAMTFTAEVAWTISDFIAMGTLVFGITSLFVLVARRLSKRGRCAAGFIFAGIYLLIWAELAVGVLG
jgi:hypothetical protein